MLIGMLGRNLAWAVIDAVMYLMGAQGERRLALSTVQAIQEAENPGAGRAIVANAAHLPPAILPALTASDLERIRVHLGSLQPNSLAPRFGPRRLSGLLRRLPALFLSLFPVAAPFLLVEDVMLAMRLSNAIAVAMLFLTGFTFGRQVGRPWRAGLLMVAIGIALVAVAMALGG